MLEAIKRRRSIRRYTDHPVTDEQVRILMEAAMAAPSGDARSPWEFVVVRDPGLRQQLANVHRYAAMAAASPVVFVVCGSDRVSEHWVEDCSAATENLLLQATDLGLGTVWVGIYPRAEYEERVRRILGIPDRIRVLCMVPAGYPAEQKRPHAGFDAAKVHYDRY